ncbi:MAG TPA: BMP family ABC transporter substrate-binding protein [Feifaniaceae bacterium]|nr:BMP family ABC transporter substrate-binding protein [Feifaniaceae bacterium]
MKKTICILLAFMMAIVMLAGCAAPAEQPGSDQPAAETKPSAEPGGTAAGEAPAEAPKVALMSMREMTQPADESTLEGVKRLKDELGIDVKIVVCLEVSEYYDQMQALCEEGYDIIYFVYDNFLEAAKELCVLYPDIEFIGLWINLNGEEVAPNLKPVHFRSEQGSFMCGVIAALMSESKQVGFIGGGNNAGIKTFLAGYEAGIQYVDNGTELVVAWANTFDDPLKGKELASSMYQKGVDVIYQAANQTGLGVFDAAREAGKYAVGVDVDQSPLAPENIICSSLLDHGYATFDSISAAVSANFNNSQVFYGVQEGMPVVAVNEALVPAEVIAQVNEIQTKIASGEIQIPTTTETE